MKALVISLYVVGASALALGCDAQGVNLGSAELCVLDPRFAELTAPTDEQVSNCAELGENVLLNPGFETPVVGACQNGLFCQFSAPSVEGWATTSGLQLIEIWHDGHRNVPAPEGSQFVELDAESPDTLSQEVALSPGQLMYWSLLHRGRNGVERMQLRIGPPAATLLQATLSSTADAWSPYSGFYRVGAAETLTRLELVSLSGTAEGNLVDAVVFAPVE
jgi:hypothetical protein